MWNRRNRAKQETLNVVLITAGPTQEPTTLLLGPTPQAPTEHSRLTTMRFLTTEDLRALLAEHWPRHDVLIMAAAVADYRPATPGGPASKHRRGSGVWNLELEPTPDLLGELAATTRPDQVTVGFALEPADELVASARKKLSAKNLDAIVANPLETIGSDRIAATVILRDGRTLTPPAAECTKHEFAEWLLDQLPAITK
jgi:phosphopantothenoylcysteine decarboxylase/phosphopantothenate--cysteine ligase